MDIVLPKTATAFLILAGILLTISEYVQCQAFEHSEKSRIRRDAGSEISMLALNAAGQAMEALQQGVAVEGERKGAINFFGAKVAAGNDFKTGFGDSINSDTDDESERRRRSPPNFPGRGRRSPCKGKFKTTTPSGADNGGNEDRSGLSDEVAKRRKRQANVNDPNQILPKKDIAETKNEFKKMVTDLMHRFMEWVHTATETVARRFD